MEYLDFCQMREVINNHEQKAPFRKQLSGQGFKLYSFVSETRSESAHGHCLELCFQGRNSLHSLFFCWRLSNRVELLLAPTSGLGVNCL